MTFLSKSDISDLNTKLETATKAELKAEQNKILTLHTHDLNYFLCKIIFDDYGFPIIFVYQSTLDTLELRKDKGADYVLSLKSKVVYASKLRSLHAAFLHSIKHFGYKVGIKFERSLLAVEQNNHATKIVNAYIIFDLDAWPRHSTNNFKLQKLLVWCD